MASDKYSIWNKRHKPWITINTYFDAETGLEVEATEIPGNYIIIKIEKNVTATKTNRIVKRTIVVRKPTHKQGRLFK